MAVAIRKFKGFPVSERETSRKDRVLRAGKYGNGTPELVRRTRRTLKGFTNASGFSHTVAPVVFV